MSTVATAERTSADMELKKYWVTKSNVVLLVLEGKIETSSTAAEAKKRGKKKER